MNEDTINRLVNRYGDRWILRDLDFFPEKLSDMCKVYPYSFRPFIEVTTGNSFVSFNTEKEALEASIQIYKNVLKQKVPYGLLHRYYLVTSEK